MPPDRLRRAPPERPQRFVDRRLEPLILPAFPLLTAAPALPATVRASG
jgi:hypothetical protein